MLYVYITRLLKWLHRNLFNFLSLTIYISWLWNIYEKSNIYVTLLIWITIGDIWSFGWLFLRDNFCVVFIWIQRNTADVDIYWAEGLLTWWKCEGFISDLLYG